MDYRYIDIIMGHTKGSSTYQECCGIWGDATHPVKLNVQVPLARIESPEALAYFRETSARFPQTETETLRRLMLRAGVHYLHKLGNGREILDLFRTHVPRTEAATWQALAAKLREAGDTASSSALARHPGTPA